MLDLPQALPALVCFTVFINTFFVLYKVFHPALLPLTRRSHPSSACATVRAATQLPCCATLASSPSIFTRGRPNDASCPAAPTPLPCRRRARVPCRFTRPVSCLLSRQGGQRELNWTAGKCAWIAASAAGGATLICICVAMPLVRRSVYREMDQK